MQHTGQASNPADVPLHHLLEANRVLVNNLQLLADPSSADCSNFLVARRTLWLADETCRLYPRQAVEHYIKRVNPAELPIQEYYVNPATYPHLARVQIEVAQHRARSGPSLPPMTRPSSMDATQPSSTEGDWMDLHNLMLVLYEAAAEVERGCPGRNTEPSTDAEVQVATHSQGHASTGKNIAAGKKRAHCTTNSPPPATTSRPSKRSRATTGAMTADPSLEHNKPLQSLETGHAPVVADMARKLPCPTAPRGQRDDPAYIEAVSDWIAERTKGAKLSKGDLSKLLVNNFMRGKVYMLHPCNDEYDESTNMDPELWGVYTEWGKTLVPEAVVYNRLTDEEKEELYDWPDRDLWKALFIVWLRHYTDRHTRVVFYQQCFRCQRGGWSCVVEHQMFTKTDIKHKSGKKSGAFRSACIPCRVSKADCSHSKLTHQLEEVGMGMADLELYWDREITLSELFARVKRQEEESNPFDPHGIPNRIDHKEDATFAVIEGLEKARAPLPLIPARATITKCQRDAREVRLARRAERDKVIAGECSQEMKKLAMVKYLANRLQQGTLTKPMFAWKDLDKSIRGNMSQRTGGRQSRSPPKDVGPYPDFYSFWMGAEGTRAGSAASSQGGDFTFSSSIGYSSQPQFSFDDTVPELATTRSPTTEAQILRTPGSDAGTLPGDRSSPHEPEGEPSGRRPGSRTRCPVERKTPRR